MSEKHTGAEDGLGNIDIVDLYLNDIGQHELLTKEDEVELAQIIEIGKCAEEQLQQEGLTQDEIAELESLVKEGLHAKEKFVISNLRLVVNIAKKRYKNAKSMELLDKIDEGNIGLMHAVEKFDWRKGFKFSTYATWWVVQAMSRGVKKSDLMIDLPVTVYDELVSINRSVQELYQTLHRYPSIEEISAKTEINTEKIIELLGYTDSPLSLDSPVDDDSNGKYVDLIADTRAGEEIEELIDGHFNSELCEKLFQHMNDRTKEIFMLRYYTEDGKKMSYEEIGKILGLRREAVRSMEARQQSKFRHPSMRAVLRISVEDV